MSIKIVKVRSSGSNFREYCVNTDLIYRISKDFWTHEILPPEYFMLDPIDFNQMISPFLRIVPQKIRDHFKKPVIINNWYHGGLFKNSGARSPQSTEGAERSYHKINCAVDVKIAGMKPIEIMGEIVNHSDKFLPLITAYEPINYTPTWNHFDGRFTGSDKIIPIKMK